MRMGNGMGCVYKMKGKRRKPWRVVVTDRIEYNEETGKAKQIRKVVGNYITQKEAVEALTYYNQNPYDLDSNKITFAELYDQWSKLYFETIVPSAARSVKSAYNYSKSLHNMRFRDIRPNHMEQCISDVSSPNIKGRMKSMFNLMYKYALKNEVVDKDYASMFTIGKRGNPNKPSVPFTEEEEKLLWDNVEFPFVDMLLIEMYSGWRPQELAILKVSDIDLDAGTMLGGLKTDAGKNRIVPIHPKIMHLVRRNYENAVASGSEYIFNDINGQQGTYMTYDKYRGRWDKIKKRFPELKYHHLHETRHTFITKAKAAGVDEYIIKLIVGHSIIDITEKVYTHRTIDELRKGIEKIK